MTHKYVLKCGEETIIGIRDRYELTAKILECIDKKLSENMENIEITVYRYTPSE